MRDLLTKQFLVGYVRVLKLSGEVSWLNNKETGEKIHGFLQCYLFETAMVDLILGLQKSTIYRTFIAEFQPGEIEYIVATQIRLLLQTSIFQVFLQQAVNIFINQLIKKNLKSIIFQRYTQIIRSMRYFWKAKIL